MHSNKIILVLFLVCSILIVSKIVDLGSIGKQAISKLTNLPQPDAAAVPNVVKTSSPIDAQQLELNAIFAIQTVTPEKLETLKALFNNNKALAKEQKKLNLQKSSLLALQKAINQDVDKLNEASKHMELLMAKYEDHKKSNLNKLVSMYEKMDPKIAAQIINGLDHNISIELMLNFSSNKSSAILSNINQDKARIITTELLLYNSGNSDVAGQ